MRTLHATAQHIGLRSDQCDATAVRTGPDGVRAFVLLDGTGSSPAVRAWTRNAAARLAARAARHGDAATALRGLYETYAADPDRQDPYVGRYMPAAAAVVAVTGPGRMVDVAWSGDARAYLIERGVAVRLTDDHNMHRVIPPTAAFPYGGSRNEITAYLGCTRTDEEAQARYGHPAMETTTRSLTGPARLLLASDGAYEPHLDNRHDLVTELESDAPLSQTVREFVDLAVETAIKTSRAVDPNRVHADNATALLAELTP